MTAFNENVSIQGTVIIPGGNYLLVQGGLHDMEEKINTSTEEFLKDTAAFDPIISSDVFLVNLDLGIFSKLELEREMFYAMHTGAAVVTSKKVNGKKRSGLVRIGSIG